MEQMQSLCILGFSSFLLTMHKLCICVYICTRGQTHAHTHHSLCKVLCIVYQVLNFKTQKILVNIFYILFYQTCQTPSWFRMWVWISANDSPSLAWKPRHGPCRKEQEVLPCTRKPSTGSHSHPQNASSKAPASCQVESDTGFPESSICFWGKFRMNQAYKNWSVLSVPGGCQSKQCITGRMACGLEDEALQKAEAQRKMCYF